MDPMDFDQTQAIFLDDVESDDVTDDIDPEEGRKPAGYLKVLHQKGMNETTHPLYDGDNIIGRGADTCHVCIASKSLSKEHACIQIQGQNNLIFDKGSRNKTKRGKMYLTPEVRYEIREGDEISFADIKCVFMGKKTMDTVEDSGSDTDESLLLHPESGGGESTMEIEPAGGSSSHRPSKSKDAKNKSDLVMVEDTPEQKKDKPNGKGQMGAPVQTLVFSESESEDEGPSTASKGPTVQDTLLCADSDPDASVDQEVFCAATQAYVSKKPEEISDDDEPSGLLGAATQFYPGVEDKEEDDEEEESAVLNEATQAFVQPSKKSNTSATASPSQSKVSSQLAGTQSFDQFEPKKGNDSADSSNLPTQVFEEEEEEEEEDAGTEESGAEKLFAMSTLAVDADEIVEDSEDDESGPVSGADAPTQAFGLDIDAPTQKFPAEGDSETVDVAADATMAISESIKNQKKKGNPTVDKNRNISGKVSAKDLSGTVPVSEDGATVAVDETVAVGGDTQKVSVPQSRRKTPNKKPPADVPETVVINEDEEEETGTVAVDATVPVADTQPVKGGRARRQADSKQGTDVTETVLIEEEEDEEEPKGRGRRAKPSADVAQTVVIEEDEEEEEEATKVRGRGKRGKRGVNVAETLVIQDDEEEDRPKGRQGRRTGKNKRSVSPVVTNTVVINDDEEEDDEKSEEAELIQEGATQAVQDVSKTSPVLKGRAGKSTTCPKISPKSLSQVDISEDSDDDEVESPWKTNAAAEEATQAYGLGVEDEDDEVESPCKTSAAAEEATQAYGLGVEDEDEDADQAEPTQAYGLEAEAETQVYGSSSPKKGKQSPKKKSNPTSKVEDIDSAECEPTQAYGIDDETPTQVFGGPEPTGQDVGGLDDDEATQPFDDGFNDNDYDGGGGGDADGNDPTQRYDMVTTTQEPTQKYEMVVDEEDEEKPSTAQGDKMGEVKADTAVVELDSDSEDESMLCTDKVSTEVPPKTTPESGVKKDVKESVSPKTTVKSPVKSSLADRRSPSPVRKRVAFAQDAKEEASTEEVSPPRRATRGAMSPKKEESPSPKKGSPNKKKPTATETQPATPVSPKGKRGRPGRNARSEQTEVVPNDKSSKTTTDPTKAEAPEETKVDPTETEAKAQAEEEETKPAGRRGRGHGRKAAAVEVEKSESNAAGDQEKVDDEAKKEETPKKVPEKGAVIEKGKRGRRGKGAVMESTQEEKSEEVPKSECVKEEEPAETLGQAKGNRGRGRPKGAAASANKVTGKSSGDNDAADTTKVEPNQTPATDSSNKDKEENVDAIKTDEPEQKAPEETTRVGRKTTRGGAKRKGTDSAKMPSPSLSVPSPQKKSRLATLAAPVDHSKDGDETDDTASVASSVDSKDTDSLVKQQTTRKGRSRSKQAAKPQKEDSKASDSSEAVGTRTSSRGRRISSNPYMKDFDTTGTNKGKNRRGSSVASDDSKTDSPPTDNPVGEVPGKSVETPTASEPAKKQRGGKKSAAKKDASPNTEKEAESAPEPKVPEASTKPGSRKRGKAAIDTVEESSNIKNSSDTKDDNSSQAHSKTSPATKGKGKQAAKATEESIEPPITPGRGRRSGVKATSTVDSTQSSQASTDPSKTSSQPQTPSKRGRKQKPPVAADDTSTAGKEEEESTQQEGKGKGAVGRQPGGRKRGNNSQMESPAPKSVRLSQPTTPSTKVSQSPVVNSPSLRKSTLEYSPKVMFTGLIDEQGEKIVRDLGGEIAPSIHECSHLVTDKVRRTVKFLAGLGKGVLIVSPQWLNSCKQAGTFLDGHKFLLTDSAMEKQYKFSLTTSIHKAQQKLLLEGYRVHVSPSVRPDPGQMQDILQCAGAEFVKSMPSGKGSPDMTTVVISCEADEKVCQPAIKAGLPVVGVEFVLTGILRQELNMEQYRLFQATGQTASRSRSKKK